MHQSRATVEAIESALESVSELETIASQNKARIEKLRSVIAQGSADMSEVSGFDLRGVEQDVSDMRQIDSRLAAELQQIEQQMQEAAEKRENAEREAQGIDPEDLERMLQAIEVKKQQLQDMQNRIIFNPSQGDSKTPWLVEVSADGFVVAEAGVTAAPTTLATATEFRQWARQRNKNSEYFVLLVKPDGIENFQQSQPALQQSGFDIGYDLLQADQIAIDPVIGASAP